MNRRTFLKTTAAGGAALVIGFVIPGCREKNAESLSVNAFIEIGSDNFVTLTIPRPEMGQGVRTSLAMILADELDCDWTNVRIRQAELNEERYGSQYVGGSSSVRDSWKPLREAAASARLLFVQAAARKWNIDPSGCKTGEGRVYHPATREAFTYGELTHEARTIHLPEHAPLKDSGNFKLVGKRTRSVDVSEIVTGRIRYGIDSRMPGMLFAAVQRCPYFGGRIRSIDDSIARAMSGVKAIVRIDSEALPELGEDNPKPNSGVAVVAGSTWEAFKAAEALKIEWDLSAAERSGTDEMRREWTDRVRRPGHWIYRNDGDVDRALESAATALDAIYELPFLSHATMEPMNCLASVKSDRVDMVCPCQNPGGIRDVAVKLTGVPAQNVHVQPARMGGGFGRRFYSDFATEAVLASKAVGVPVLVTWTREDDMRHGFYRPAGIYRVRGAIDRAGKITGWYEHLVNASRGHFLKWQAPPGKELKPGEIERDDFPAGLIPNFRIEYTHVDSLIPRGQWRAVEDSSNVFVIQSFLAELAHAAGKDPLALNLELLKDMEKIQYEEGSIDAARLRRVFEIAADQSQWNRPLPNGWGRGIAGCFSHGAYAAEVAEVEVSSAGGIRVHRIVAAIDVGRVINPSGVEAQTRGGILFGLSAALKQEMTVTRGRADQGNFDEFPVIQMNEIPQIDVHLVASEAPPSGAGEGAVPQVAPAVANAVFNATGKRIRHLPLRFA